jgi:hypothetical protein
MRARSVRVGAVTKLLLGLVVVLPPAAAAERVDFAHGTIDQTLTTTRPNAAAGFHFIGRYHAAGDPDAPPPYLRKMTGYDNPRRDTSVPERCTASDLELAANGAAACPEGSRLGGGTADTLFMGSFPNRAEIEVFNNTAEQIMLVRSPVLTTVTRGRISPDGTSIEFTSPTCFPSHAGCPVDNVLQVGSDVTMPPYTRSSGGTVRSYMTTPAKCPKSGRWTSTIRMWWADGSDDTIVIRQPCKRPKAKRGRKSGKRPARRG